MPARAPRGDRASQIARQSPRFKDEAKALGERVRELRETRGWTLERAAEETTVDWKHWQKIESGQINLTLVTLVRIAEGFDVSLAELFAPAKGRGKS
jgi:transcriptional regulator with XRE-family HTH domain